MIQWENKKKYIDLFDLYSSLLTDKQINYFILYFFEDYSLNEIAILKKISKTAVFDAINKIINHLNKFESKLLILKKQELREKLYKLHNNKENVILINELIKIDQI